MRTVLAALALASFGIATPAQAAPQLHVVSPQIAAWGGRVTCDTSGYPAASYPCTFDLVSNYCSELLRGGTCRLEVAGPLVAMPASSHEAKCWIVPTGNVTVTFDSGTFHASTIATPSSFSPVSVVNGSGVVARTPYLLDVWGVSGSVGEMLIGYSFPDIEWDCRTRAGGDPVGTGDPLTAIVTWAFVE
jgi:hypothetical protein